MALESLKTIMPKAKKNQYAVGQFNINTFQWAEATLRVAERERSPIILASTDRIVDYLGGFELIAVTIKKMIEDMDITVPVILHLDHGLTVSRCKEAVDAGYSSVMYDGSKLSLEENIANTKEVVEYAQKNNVSVEAEIGSVGGTEDGITSGIKYASPNECYKLVKETGVDLLAAALGSVHGVYEGQPKLAFDLMKEISDNLEDVPLALHGGSGIPEHQIVKAIKYGHSKINVNTEINQAWTLSVRKYLEEYTKSYNVPEIMQTGMKAIETVVTNKIHLFDSSNKI